MIPTLPGQFEFLSDAFVAEGQAFLDRETAALRARDAAKPFTVSERFTDAPPHLAFPDNLATWQIAFDGERVDIRRGFNPDADVTIEGDYQAAVVAQQFVGAASPTDSARAHREVAQMFGKDCIRVNGTFASEPLNAMFAQMHDHMARRTIENPDLAHRAARLGLTGKIREMEEQGYTILENALSPDFADEIRACTQRALTAHNTVTLQWMLYHGREIELLAQNPRLMTLIDASLGRGAVIASLSAIRRGPGPGFIPMHTDYAHVPEPYPEFAMTGVGVWALEDWTRDSGPTWIVPGSHKMRRAPRPGEGHNAGIPIEMPKGSVVFFTHGVWHWQGDRTEPGERVTLHMHYNRGILRSLEPKKVDPQMMHRNAPRLGEMLGEDDWFDKMSGIGRDHVRFAYMQQLHAFTARQKAQILADAA
jgi:ectoine hydroxylase-related dioxygenase (phytanoyl-CoA dioxygenase family)